eukprot:g68075.t1
MPGAGVRTCDCQRSVPGWRPILGRCFGSMPLRHVLAWDSSLRMKACALNTSLSLRIAKGHPTKRKQGKGRQKKTKYMSQCPLRHNFVVVNIGVQNQRGACKYISQ